MTEALFRAAQLNVGSVQILTGLIAKFLEKVQASLACWNSQFGCDFTRRSEKRPRFIQQCQAVRDMKRALVRQRRKACDLLDGPRRQVIRMYEQMVKGVLRSSHFDCISGCFCNCLEMQQRTVHLLVSSHSRNDRDRVRLVAAFARVIVRNPDRDPDCSDRAYSLRPTCSFLGPQRRGSNHQRHSHKAEDHNYTNQSVLENPAEAGHAHFRCQNVRIVA